MFSSIFKLPDTTAFFTRFHTPLKPPSLSIATRPLFTFRGGYINYNWNLRSSIDTPFAEKNISQNLLSASLNFTIAQTIPIRIMYFQRESNSAVFRDFHDIRIEFDAQEFRKMQANKMQRYFTGVVDNLRDPFSKSVMDVGFLKKMQLHDWLNQNSIINQLKDARIKLIRADKNDSIGLFNAGEIKKAKEFVEFYEKTKQEEKKYQSLYDSVKSEVTKKEQQIKLLHQLIKGDFVNDPRNLQLLKKTLAANGITDKRVKKLLNTFNSVKTLAIGKTLPVYSDLTVKNVNVNGVNFEYNCNNLYLAITAGTVDYRVRDFVYQNQRRVPQFVYAGRIGYGSKEGNNIIATYFQGKKQVLAGSISNSAVSIYGMSLAMQLILAKNSSLNGEIAQSASPALLNSTTVTEKSSFNFKDNSNRAYSVRFRSYLPATKTRIEAYYQHKGLNFQNFSDYQVNAVSNTWYVKGDQYVWRKMLHISLAARKNDFSNPLVLQRYNANTVFKNLNITFRKRFWPVISIGYIPSSQYTVIDSQVYENHYQVFNANVFYQYKIGAINSSTVAIFNRFYNDNRDTGFLYYNANNYYLNQTFYFSRFTGNVGYSHTENAQYTLDIMDAGITAKIFKSYLFGFGIKINHTNSDGSKVGLYGNSQFAIPKVGELTLWMEKNYLPGWKQGLVKNEFYSVGFTRYLK